MRKKRILIFLGVAVSLLALVYLARQWLFEGMIIRKAQAELQALMGAKVTIGAVRGNWITRFEIESVTIEGGKGSAYRDIRDVDLDVDVSLWSLLGGDLAGLEKIRIRGKRVELDTEGSWTAPSESPTPPSGDGPDLAQLLSLLRDGGSIAVEQLVLHPGYVAPGAVTVDLTGGTDSRSAKITAATVTAEGSIEQSGAFQVKVTGSEAGRVLKALRVDGAQNLAGPLTTSLVGTTAEGTWRSDLNLSTSIGPHEVQLRYQLERRDQRYYAPEVVAELPGLRATTKNIALPTNGWNLASLLSALRGRDNAVVDLQVEDLERYKSLLPRALLPYLPIRGGLRAEVLDGFLAVRASTLRAKNITLELEGGRIALPENGSPEALREARVQDLQARLTLAEGAGVETAAGRIAAVGTVSTKISGSLGRPDARASLDLAAVRFAGHQIAGLTGEWTFDGQAAKGTSIEIQAARIRQQNGLSAPIDLTGTASYTLPTADSPQQVALDLRGPLTPLLDLGWPGATEALRTATTDTTIRTRANLALGPALGPQNLPTGSVTVDFTNLRFAPMRPIAVTAVTTLEPQRVRVSSLTADSAAGRLALTGDVDLAAQVLDLTTRGKVDTLQPLLRALGQPDLRGSMELAKLRIQGPWTQPTTVEIDAKVALTRIADDWWSSLSPSLRDQIPNGPLDLTLAGSHRPAGADVKALLLNWGNPEHRIQIQGSGPVPLRLDQGNLRGAKRSDPLAIELKATTNRPLPDLPVRRLDAQASVRLRHDQVEIPLLTATSRSGSLRCQDLRAALGIDAMLTQRIDWPNLQVGGGIELRQFDIAPLITRIQGTAVPRIRVAGELTGEVAVSGPLIRPRILGSLRLREGQFQRQGTPTLNKITGTAKFAAARIDLDLAATGTKDLPVRIEASAETRNATLTQAALAPDTPIAGEVRLEGIDLALLQPLLPDLPNLTGTGSLTGTVGGTSGAPQPDLRLTVKNAAWQLRTEKERIEGVQLGLRLTDRVARLSRCEGKVPSLNLKVSASGELEVENAKLWELRAGGDQNIRCNLGFTDIPLDLIPRRNGLEAAKGMASGSLEIRGPMSNLRPKLRAEIRGGAFKIDQVPRIEGLTATIEGDNTALAVRAAAQMGAGPMRIAGRWTAGEGSLIEAFRKGKITASLDGTQVLLARTGGLKLRGDVELRAEGPVSAVAVTGAVTLENSRFIKRLSLVPDLRITSGALSGSPFGPWGVPGGENVRVNVRLQTRQPITVRTNVVDTKLGLNCRMVGTGAAMHLEGDCSASEGTLRFPGMAMRISSLRMLFSKADPTRPKLLASASGQRHGIRIDLGVRGAWNDPIVSLSSVPALQARELWSLVTTGVRPTTLANNDATSNTAILATYVVQELLLTYFASESTEASESLVARFSFEFGRELSRNGAETWEVNFDVGGLWRIPHHFGLRFERDVYEDFNLGVVYRWRF